MENPTEVYPRESLTEVYINDWPHRRELMIASDNLALRLTPRTCGTCSTCRRRIEEITATLARKPEIRNLLVYHSGGVWLVLIKPEERQPHEFLRDALELSSVRPA